jgi:hypothetical protein
MATLQSRITSVVQAIAADIKLLFKTHIDLYYVSGAWETIPTGWTGKIYWISIGFPAAPTPPMRAGDLWYRQE